MDMSNLSTEFNIFTMLVIGASILIIRNNNVNPSRQIFDASNDIDDLADMIYEDGEEEKGSFSSWIRHILFNTIRSIISTIRSNPFYDTRILHFLNNDNNSREANNINNITSHYEWFNYVLDMHVYNIVSFGENNFIYIYITLLTLAFRIYSNRRHYMYNYRSVNINNNWYFCTYNYMYENMIQHITRVPSPILSTFQYIFKFILY